MSSLVVESEACSNTSLTPPVVSISNVKKVYENNVIAVQNVNLDVQEGEFISIVGPSGCGKSTIFRLIAGLEVASYGTLKVLGENPEYVRKQNEISYVFQDATLMPWGNTLKNVMLPLQLRGIPEKARLAEAERVLKLVGLEKYGKSLPRQLSGGMKMRVSIARALIANPKLLLMDEPFGALDEITRQTLQNELLEIWRKDNKMTILFVTHNVYEAVYLSTRVIVMSTQPGKIEADISISEPFPRGEEFRITPKFNEYVSQVNEALKY